MKRTIVPHRTAGAAGKWLLKREQIDNGKKFKLKQKTRCKKQKGV